MSELTVAVTGYLAQGHHLLALRGKRPHPVYHKEWDWDNSIHGDPMGDSAQHVLNMVFHDDPTVTGVAILIPQHVLVADIDTDAAAELFRDLAGNPKETRMARTTKGLHVWYMAPGAAGSRWLGDRTLLFKGFGGYVAAPPSKHFTDETLREQDGTYQWIDDGEMDWLPDGIAGTLSMMEEAERFKPKRDDEDMTRIELQFDKAGSFESMWPTWHMDGLAHAVETAKDGNQNNMIHWAACVARDGGVPYEVCMDTLLAAALRGGHPRSRAVSTIRGAYKRRRG